MDLYHGNTSEWKTRLSFYRTENFLNLTTDAEAPIDTTTALAGSKQ